MAGIGFEIRKILKKKTLFSLMESYSYAGIVSSGPWLISMVSIFISGYLASKMLHNDHIVLAFMICVTYLIAFSLIITSFFQLSFTRFLADIIFEKKLKNVLPNTIGAVILNMFIGGLFVVPMSFSLYKAQGFSFAVLFGFNFIVFCAIWIVNVVLSGLKNYKFIAFSFFVSYLLIVALVYQIGMFGLFYLLLSFFIGQVLLLFLLIALVAKNFPSEKTISFEFLREIKKYRYLVFSGFFLTISVWVDKILFWYMPQTSVQVVGLLRYSPIYDLPIFLAYLTIAPGMAMFLLRIETEFVEHYDKYYKAVRDGGTLKEIYKYENDMVVCAKFALVEILRVQLLTTFTIMMFSKYIFAYFYMPFESLPIFYVDLIGVALQLMFMSITVILFYLNKIKEVFIVSVVLFLSNLILSFLSIKMGIFFYGYGFGISYFGASVMALFYLNKSFKRLHYETFMLN